MRIMAKPAAVLFLFVMLTLTGLSLTVHAAEIPQSMPKMLETAKYVPQMLEAQEMHVFNHEKLLSEFVERQAEAGKLETAGQSSPHGGTTSVGDSNSRITTYDLGNDVSRAYMIAQAAFPGFIEAKFFIDISPIKEIYSKNSRIDIAQDILPGIAESRDFRDKSGLFTSAERLPDPAVVVHAIKESIFGLTDSEVRVLFLSSDVAFTFLVLVISSPDNIRQTLWTIVISKVLYVLVGRVFNFIGMSVLQSSVASMACSMLTFSEKKVSEFFKNVHKEL